MGGIARLAGEAPRFRDSEGYYRDEPWSQWQFSRPSEPQKLDPESRDARMPPES